MSSSPLFKVSTPSRRFTLPGRPTSGSALHLPPLPTTSFSSSPGPFFLRTRKSDRILRQVITGAGVFSAPLISPGDQWGMWTFLMATASFGIWSENTKVGNAISGAMVSILVGLVASSAGVISAQSPTYQVVMEFLLPLAIPLLLFNADLRRVMKSTGNLLLAFLIGSAATTIGTVVAYFIVPMRSLGQDSWKIAAAIMSRHIGGAVNYVAVSEALGVSPSILAAGLAADNIVCAVYFVSLFALASKIGAEDSPSKNDGLLHYTPEGDKFSKDSEEGSKLPILQSTIAISVSFAICKLATNITKLFGVQGGKLPCITAIIVILATLFPVQFGALAPTGEAIALILMQVFFAVVGANGSLWNVVNTTPAIFAFSTIQIVAHLAVILALGRFFGFEKKMLLIASNANVGGPTTACGMATAKGWNSLIIPGILAGVFGIAIATFISIGFGLLVLKKM
ncbi:hypothetical protein KSP40_PGU005182 [Platanthera guangdongensis]|uniref:Membrane protein YjcL n=1 Tax=Platanthera guangdongensis TaxID=2320717 RepID=A0ABR2N2F5_9ASPA